MFKEVKYAIKAIQKKRVKDYLTFQNEIKLLRILVSTPTPLSTPYLFILIRLL